MEKIKVLFVIYLDKFTDGLYGFLKNNFDFESKFLIYGKKHQFDFDNDPENTVFIDHYKAVNKSSQCYEWAKKADLIVFSGLFGTDKLFLRFPKGSVDKSYLQLWGGDFYPLRDTKGVSLKNRIGMLYKKRIINKAKGIITLIPDDYKELCSICHPGGKHFIAPVCDNGYNMQLINEYRQSDKSGSTVWVLLGNSATESNQHFEALDLMSRYKDEDIKIVCPLSYGDDQYAAKVNEYGRSIFGDKFVGLTKYLDKNEYYQFLSKFSIAVFNNNRQQGMGNINAALAMGCKVYIRNDTAMWSKFTSEGFNIYDIGGVSALSFNEFVEMPEDKKSHNYEQYSKTRCIEAKVNTWKKVFDSIAHEKE